MTIQTGERGAAARGGNAAERFAYPALNALSEHVAVVDARGRIIAVNRAWRDFAAANSPDASGLCEGANYFDACAGATGRDALDGARFATGLRAILDSELEEFALEYSCHSDCERRWFIARARRFEYEGEARAVVTQSNITARVLAEKERERLLGSLEAERARLARLLSEHERAEAQARSSEERYRALFDSIDEGFGVAEVLFDEAGRGRDHRFLVVNPSFEKQSGVPVELLLSGKTVGELIPQIERHWSETYGRVALTGEPERFVGGSDALGSWFDVYVFGVGGGGRPRVAVLFSNITERMKAEEALRRSEGKYRLLLEQASDGIHTYDERGNFVETNSKLCEMLGYTREELLCLNVADLVPPEDLSASPIRFDRLKAGETVLTERRLRRKDGTIFPVEISGRMIREGEMQAIIRDISERKRGEDALRDAYDELERRVEERTAQLEHAYETLKAEVAERERAEDARRDLLGRLVTAQEEERRRISRELHDRMGQQLAALMMGLKTLGSESYGRRSALDTLRQLEEMSDELSREVHTLAWGLRPPALDDMGLETALYNYAEEWAERSRVPVDFHSAGFRGGRLPLTHETALYRIAQEALTNVAKHSGASRVSFILERRGDHVFAVIEDNGGGFDVEAATEPPGRGRRLGLLGMRERAALLGGTINVESEPGVGTTLFVRIPFGAGGGDGGG